MKFVSKILLALLATMLVSAIVFAQETDANTEELNPLVIDIGVGGTNTAATGIDCFDYYTFGSVDFVFLHADKHNYNPEETVEFLTTIRNNNPYPLVEGGVFAQVYWLNTESGDMQGDNLIDEFWLIEDLTLDTNQEYPLAFSWKIPKKAPNGYYYIALFYQVKKSFNMSGLPFINNVYGGSAGFNVENGQEKASFYFDRNTVRLQGAEQMLRNFSQSFKEGETIEYKIALKNPNSTPTGALIEYELYDWDSSQETNLMEKYSKKQVLSIEANSSADASISFEGLKAGAYLLKIKAEANMWNTMINLRFSVEGNKGRFVFSGLDKFPLKKGDKFILFSCFSNSTDWFSEFDGKAEISIVNHDTKKVIDKTEYSGKITPKIIASKKELTAGSDLYAVDVVSKIYGPDGALDQEITIAYDFAKFQTQESYKKYVLPLVDKDSDTVLNEEDECPEQAGTAENKGCPAPTPTPAQTQQPQPTPAPQQKADIIVPLIAVASIIVIVLVAFFMVKKKKKSTVKK
ncbi:MAG: hypothetical protein NT067_06425 [Candidatus Diapherotrites archaeon]|nr:hypothetical protein [Candidatus Diapherotrites archaeon]